MRCSSQARSLGGGRDAEAGGEEGGAGEQIASWRGHPSIASTCSFSQGIFYACVYRVSCNCTIWSITVYFLGIHLLFDNSISYPRISTFVHC